MKLRDWAEKETSRGPQVLETAVLSVSIRTFGSRSALRHIPESHPARKPVSELADALDSKERHLINILNLRSERERNLRDSYVRIAAAADRALEFLR